MGDHRRSIVAAPHAMAGTFVEHFWNYCEKEHPWAVGPMGVFVVHQVTYFGAYLPYFISDYVPALRQYKIQQKKHNEAWNLWRCFKWLCFLHLVFELPMIILAHPFFQGYLNARNADPQFPTVATLAWQILMFYLVEDFYFYWIHRLLHWGPLYGHIHKVHHEYQAPFGIAGEYAHPLETMFLGLGTAAGPFMLATMGMMHIATLFVWMVFRVAQVIDAHSGYDFPWSLNRFVPFWGGAEFHDFHHEKFTDNYASTFKIWDSLFGTNKKYLEQRARERAEKEKRQSSKKKA